MSLLIQRRVFMMSLATATASTSTLALAQAPVMLDEKDPQAVAMGYVADAKRADAKKFPKYAAGQVCTNCSLFQGKPTDKVGGCPIFGAKKVAGPGWCNAWVKKA